VRQSEERRTAVCTVLLLLSLPALAAHILTLFAIRFARRSLAAVESGCRVVQGTINGIGERTGNTDLTSIVAVLGLRMSNSFYTSMDPACLTVLSKDVYSVCRIEDQDRPRGQPFVGVDAFAHKGGLHAAAMEKDPTSYQFCNVRIDEERRTEGLNEATAAYRPPL